MTTNTPIAGRKCLLLINLGTFSTPVWTEAKQVTDVKLPWATEFDDVSCRASQFNLSHPVSDEVSTTFGYVFVKGMVDTIFSKLYTAKQSKPPAPVHIAICDGPIATAGTYVAELCGYLSKFDETQDLKTTKKYDCEFKPGMVFDGTSLMEPDFYIAS